MGGDGGTAGGRELQRLVQPLLQGRVRGRTVFGIEVTDCELELVTRLFGGKKSSSSSSKENADQVQNLREKLEAALRDKEQLADELEAQQRAKEAGLLKLEQTQSARLLDNLRSQQREARLTAELEAAQRESGRLGKALAELREAGHGLLAQLERESLLLGEGAVLQNSMLYVALSKNGQWNTRSIPLPEAALGLLEQFVLPPEHPASGGGGAQGVRLRTDAGRGLEKGELVMYYAGHVRCGVHSNQCDPSDYPCPLSSNADAQSTDPVVDALHLGNLSRFLNDARGSAEPCNCFIQFEEVRCEKQPVVLVAVRTLRVIQPGEELTIDYGEAFWAAKERRDAPRRRAMELLRNHLE